MAKETELLKDDLVITHIRVGDPPSNLGLKGTWESRSGAIWVLRNISNVSIDFKFPLILTTLEDPCCKAQMVDLILLVEYFSLAGHEAMGRNRTPTRQSFYGFQPVSRFMPRLTRLPPEKSWRQDAFQHLQMLVVVLSLSADAGWRSPLYHHAYHSAGTHIKKFP